MISISKAEHLYPCFETEAWGNSEMDYCEPMRSAVSSSSVLDRDRQGLLLILACDLHCNSCWHIRADLCGSVVEANLCGFSSIGDEFNIGIMLNANILSTKQTCTSSKYM